MENWRAWYVIDTFAAAGCYKPVQIWAVIRTRSNALQRCDAGNLNSDS
jgi:hypothetical protein